MNHANKWQEYFTHTRITFTNDTGTVSVFTNTLAVIARIVAIVQTNLASAGGCNMSLGVVGNTALFIPLTDVTLMVADEIWHDAAPDAEQEAFTVAPEYIVAGGQAISLTLSAQVDSGAIDFHCMWRPLTPNSYIEP